ncbi:MAG TPA: apolipoprotein N-acyltransferase [Stellaceae bacterium]|nr:apolipoprotein N-acyltransferase [Stellaceae bacterium]
MAHETARLRRFAAAVAALRGWRRAGLALALGVAAAGAMPPFNLVPLLLATFPGLVWLLDGAGSKRHAFFDGWLWGMGFFVPSLYWIAYSLFVDIGQFWWMVPFAVLGLPAYLSLYVGAACCAAWATTRREGLGRIAAFAGWWAVGEWFRGHLLTGFPWLLVGYAWSGDAPALLAVLQSASLVGIYGLSFATVLVAALPARLADPAPLGRRIAPAAIGLAVAAAAGAWGASRLASGEDPTVPGVTVRIVSTDLPHRADWDPKAVAEDFRTVRSLARSPGLDGVQISAWPEGVVDAPLNRDADARAAVVPGVPPGGLVLTGTIHAEGQGRDLRVWNSVMAETGEAAVIGIYDKHHLVPFGEFVPFHEWLSFSQIASSRFDFSTGPGPATLDLPGLPPVAPIICYEAIFPGEVVDESHRPGWMLNVTDDGWFGRSIGPEQHFAIARVRAVEEGLPLVRAANGGISGLVDAHGRRVASLPLGQPGVLDLRLPGALQSYPLYVQYSNTSLVFLVIIAIFSGTLPVYYLGDARRLPFLLQQ